MEESENNIIIDAINTDCKDSTDIAYNSTLMNIIDNEETRNTGNLTVASSVTKNNTSYTDHLTDAITRNDQRFQLELEFVMLLCNPLYLQHLSHSKSTTNPPVPLLQCKEFINYLKYLQYFNEPVYAKYVEFPYALEILQLMQNAGFRGVCGDVESVRRIHERQFGNWESGRREGRLIRDSL